MLQISSTNCSPIRPKPHQNFGRGEMLTATADWLENIDTDNITEDNFIGLDNLSSKMHDGPLKTFAKILSIGGTAFLAAKAGSTKVANKIANNKMISKNVSTPVIEFVKTSMTKAQKALKENPLHGEHNKGFKAYFVNTASKGLDAIEKYGKRGSEKLVKNIEQEIKDLKELQKGAKGTELNEIKDNINALMKRKRNAATENLITKITTNTVGAGAGTVAVVEANKDRDNNGIADIGEHDV